MENKDREKEIIIKSDKINKNISFEKLNCVNSKTIDSKSPNPKREFKIVYEIKRKIIYENNIKNILWFTKIR